MSSLNVYVVTNRIKRGEPALIALFSSTTGMFVPDSAESAAYCTRMTGDTLQRGTATLCSDHKK
jgi:hypothetical protein